MAMAQRSYRPCCFFGSFSCSRHPRFHLLRDTARAMTEGELPATYLFILRQGCSLRCSSSALGNCRYQVGRPDPKRGISWGVDVQDFAQSKRIPLISY